MVVLAYLVTPVPRYRFRYEQRTAAVMARCPPDNFGTDIGGTRARTRTSRSGPKTPGLREGNRKTRARRRKINAPC